MGAALAVSVTTAACADLEDSSVEEREPRSPATPFTNCERHRAGL
jgi:hypothetical protein